MMTDPLGDMLTRIRNGQRARQAVVAAPASKMRANVLDVLRREGYIRGFTQEQVSSRLAQLSPQDLHQLAQNLDQLQAAGLTKQEWIWVGLGALAVLILLVALG